MRFRPYFLFKRGFKGLPPPPIAQQVRDRWTKSICRRSLMSYKYICLLSNNKENKFKTYTYIYEPFATEWKHFKWYHANLSHKIKRFNCTHGFRFLKPFETLQTWRPPDSKDNVTEWLTVTKNVDNCSSILWWRPPSPCLSQNCLYWLRTGSSMFCAWKRTRDDFVSNQKRHWKMGKTRQNLCNFCPHSLVILLTFSRSKTNLLSNNCPLDRCPL